jgi:hypothetical protein
MPAIWLTSASVLDGRLKLPAIPTSLRAAIGFPFVKNTIVYKNTRLKKRQFMIGAMREKNASFYGGLNGLHRIVPSAAVPR